MYWLGSFACLAACFVLHWLASPRLGQPVLAVSVDPLGSEQRKGIGWPLMADSAISGSTEQPASKLAHGLGAGRQQQAFASQTQAGQSSNKVSF